MGFTPLSWTRGLPARRAGFDANRCSRQVTDHDGCRKRDVSEAGAPGRSGVTSRECCCWLRHGSVEPLKPAATVLEVVVDAEDLCALVVEADQPGLVPRHTKDWDRR